MGKGLIILMVLCVVIFIGSIMFILITNYKNKVLSLTYKMRVSDKSIKDNLNDKFDLVTRSINIIERELKIESKKFEAVKKIRNEKINNIKFDNVLSEATEEIFNIKDDYKEIEKIKSFKGIINDIKDLDIMLSGAKKFYNKYASEYNSLAKRFPYKLFSKKLPYKQLYIDNIMEEKLETGLEL